MAPVAKNVLVFMLVGVYGAWNLPVRYFLVSDLTTDLQLNLLHTCFEMKEEPETDCVAVVCDKTGSQSGKCTVCDGSYWAFTRYDRRTDRSVQPVYLTGRSDDRIV